MGALAAQDAAMSEEELPTWWLLTACGLFYGSIIALGIGIGWLIWA